MEMRHVRNNIQVGINTHSVIDATYRVGMSDRFY